MRPSHLLLLLAAALFAVPACASLVGFPDVPDLEDGGDGAVGDSTTEGSGSSSGSESGADSGRDSGSSSGSDSGSGSGSGSSSGSDSGGFCSEATDGTPCGSGEICHTGVCGSGCEIAGVYYAGSTANPNNACQSCQPGTSTSTWSSIADGTGCGNGQVCSAGSCGTQCDISGMVYVSGAPNPASACQSCQPGTSTTAWTTLAPGTTCGSGEVCNGTTCASGCYVGSMFVSPGPNPANVCQACTPSASTTAWISTDGVNAGCPSGEVCNGSPAACAAGCWVGGAFYAPNATANSGCEVCTPGTSVSSWTDVSGAASCPSAEVCNGGSCASGCSIGGVFYASGATTNSGCESCVPATSTTQWTNASNGMSCGNGQICSSGACGTQCDIGGTVYSSGAVNPADPCQTCQPGSGTTTWTSTDGANASCPSGDVCNGSPASCVSGCWIGGTFYAPNATMNNGCESCEPGANTTSWTNVSGAASCPSSEACNAGSCASGCSIGGTFYAPNATTNSGCEECVPASSTIAWTDESGVASCAGGEACNAGSCASGCSIGGTFYASGTVNPGNACQSCQPGASTSGWSSIGNGLSCGSGMVCESGVCGASCTITVTKDTSTNYSCTSCSLTINYQMIGGGGGGSGFDSGGGGGGGNSTLIMSGAVIIATAPGGNGGPGSTNATAVTGSFTYTGAFGVTVGGGGGGGGVDLDPLNGGGGGGGTGFYGGGGGSGWQSGGGVGGGGGTTTGGVGAVCSCGDGAPGDEEGGGNGGGASGYYGYGANSVFVGQGGSNIGSGGGGGGPGGGGGAGGDDYVGGAGGNSGANGNAASGPGSAAGLGANNWSAATTLPAAAGQGGTSYGGGNAGLVILQYFDASGTCSLQ